MIALIASAGLGALIGLIRQWHEQTEQNARGEYAGVRTFTCWSLLGCIAAFVSDEYAPGVLPVVLVLVGAHFVIGRTQPANRDPGGSTTFAAAMLTVLAGSLLYWRQHQEAVLLGGLLVVLLGLKRPIHAWTHAFTPTDIRATLQFVAVSGIVLPLAPNEAYGPFEAFNPRSIWMMVVLISGIGFLGYILMRLLSARVGIVLTSLLGGLASSTATTLEFSRRSRDDPAHSEAYALAVVVACTVMLPRVAVAVALVNRPLATQLLLPFAGMALPGLAFVAWAAWRQHRRQHRTDQPAVGNPLSLMTAVKFAALYAGITFLVKAAGHSNHLEASLLPLAFVSGLTELDAISLAVAKNGNAGAETPSLAVQAIIVAAISNSLVKGGIAAFLGSRALRWQVAVVMSLVIAAGIGAFFLVGSDGA
ncbi:MAG TPA: MgtC/SapB family protein [Lacunisphaera sp.]|nr:MgtC/SapB family protein [Lacunisphaera sp.]